MRKKQIICSGIIKGRYNLDYKWAIIDHPKLGRLYIAQDFGGIDTLAGGQYRWRHGFAVQLLPDDTIKSLSAPHNEHCTVLGAACAGHRPERPLKRWDGKTIEQIATAYGL